jgi:hypothetical protein
MTNGRELVTLSELSARLTDELQKVSDAAGSAIFVRYMLQEPDEEGCNWSDSVILKIGSGVSREVLTPYVTQLMQDARKRFNVEGGDFYVGRQNVHSDD